MSDLKTQRNDGDVRGYLEAVANRRRREDSLVMLELMSEITGEPPAMWGSSIVGFGSYRYRYASGRGGDWFLTGFAPRKQALTLYIMPGFDRYAALLAKLGKYKTGKSCLYVNKLDDVNMEALKELIAASVETMRRASPDAGE